MAEPQQPLMMWFSRLSALSSAELRGDGGTCAGAAISVAGAPRMWRDWGLKRRGGTRRGRRFGICTIRAARRTREGEQRRWKIERERGGELGCLAGERGGADGRNTRRQRRFGSAINLAPEGARGGRGEISKVCVFTFSVARSQRDSPRDLRVHRRFPPTSVTEDVGGACVSDVLTSEIILLEGDR
eukprot:scaffold103128_cov31-Tisochrysis_lutea.AAC.1